MSKNKMKIANYIEGIHWIAWNDDPGGSGALEREQVDGMISVLLLADLFGVPSSMVANDIVMLRIERYLAERLNYFADGKD